MWLNLGEFLMKNVGKNFGIPMSSLWCVSLNSGIAHGHGVDLNNESVYI